MELQQFKKADCKISINKSSLQELLIIKLRQGKQAKLPQKQSVRITQPAFFWPVTRNETRTESVIKKLVQNIWG